MSVKFIDKIQQMFQELKNEDCSGYQIAKILNANPPQILKIMKGESMITYNILQKFENIGYMPLVLLVPYNEEEYRKYEEIMNKYLEEIFNLLKEKAEKIKNNKRGRKAKNKDIEDNNINNETNKTKEIDIFSTSSVNDENVISFIE